MQGRRVPLQGNTVTGAGNMLPEFPSPLCDARQCEHCKRCITQQRAGDGLQNCATYSCVDPKFSVGFANLNGGFFAAPHTFPRDLTYPEDSNSCRAPSACDAQTSAKWSALVREYVQRHHCGARQSQFALHSNPAHGHAMCFAGSRLLGRYRFPFPSPGGVGMKPRSIPPCCVSRRFSACSRRRALITIMH